LRFSLALAAAALLLALPAVRATGAPPRTPAAAADPFLWLEDLDGPRVLAWARNENVKTLGVLAKDPHFDAFYADALKINEAKDRIPAPAFLDGRIYNFWQDPEHIRGIWRSTTLDAYAKADPAWTTVLDLDALAKTEGKNWVWESANCDSPSRTRCLIRLSEGGEDASTEREFDLRDKTFVAGGFVLPRGKQSVAWVDDDTLIAAREWSVGELTASGYPFVVKRLQRGRPLASATDVFRGKPSDVSVNVTEVVDGAGHRTVVLDRGVSFFESEKHLITASGTPELALPLKSSIEDLFANQLIVRLRDTWQAGASTYAAGSLVSIDLPSAVADPAHLHASLIYAPSAREALEGVSSTRDRLIVQTLENVKGRAASYALAPDGTWSRGTFDLPDNSTIALGSADRYGNEAFLSVTGFLTPSTLLLADAAAATVTPVKAIAPRFDASSDVVEQREATSKDGTRVPYFIVHPKNLRSDGSNATIMYAYGGFDVSETPTYNGTLGKLWLERGGTYVLANIRGGGEFGPAWHEAGLKTKRQRIYDDFAAVAENLISTKVTSPRHLGIEGGSNGGLLMGVEFTQRPDLWHAVDIQVPLLDMLRFEKIQAGASWVGEYGTVAKPDERAFLAKISPYNNLRKGVAYPEPFIWTTTKDDRVGPQHARKFAAKLAAMKLPYYFYEVTEGGHGAGANIKERSYTSALELTYFTRKLM